MQQIDSLPFSNFQQEMLIKFGKKILIDFIFQKRNNMIFVFVGEKTLP